MTSFFAWLWGKIKAGGRWLVTLLILIIIIIVGIIISKDDSNTDSASSSSSSRPEVAQVFEPSIGTPLPPDTQSETDVVAQTPAAEATPATTPTPTTPAVVAPTTGAVAGSATTTTFVAPKSGVNPNEPVIYKNNTYGFTATLPARSTVREDTNVVSFFNGNGTLLYTVSVTSNAGTLDTTAEQLRNSASVMNITKTSTANYPALQFTKGSANGIVILNGSTAYYLIGQKSYFEQFKF